VRQRGNGCALLPKRSPPAAPPSSLLVSEMKAETAAKTGYATREVGERAYGKDGKPRAAADSR
jgi:hypothetical protein